MRMHVRFLSLPIPAPITHPREGSRPVGARRPPLHSNGTRQPLPLRLQRRLPRQQHLHLMLYLVVSVGA